jgi:Dolichyl-phosphate-mannose-protein mannosyltransferase
VYRPPLFPILLGGWYRLTGTSSPVSAAVFQSLLHAAGVLAAFLLFLEVVSSLAWVFAGALWLAVNPLLVTRAAFVLQEPTMLLFMTLAAFLSVRWIKTPSTPRATLAGIAWGLCTLVKVVAWFAPFLLLAMRFLSGRLRREWRGGEAAALLLCFFIVIAPWTIRNFVQFHRLIPVNGQGEGMLEWKVSHAEIPGARPGSEFSTEVYRKGLLEGERKALLWKYVLKYPGYFFVHRVVQNAAHFAAPSHNWWDIRGYFRRGEHRAEFWILAVLFHIPFYLLLLLRSAGRAGM